MDSTSSFNLQQDKAVEALPQAMHFTFVIFEEVFLLP